MKEPSLVFENQLKTTYYGIQDLKYSTKADYFLSSQEVDALLAYEESVLRNPDQDKLERLPLKAYNSEFVFYANCEELLGLEKDYFRTVYYDALESSAPLSARNNDEITRSRVYSELEGSVNIENVPTTRKRTADLLTRKIQPENRNDLIVLNMDSAIDFVSGKPKFTKDNLRKLYDILSRGCLDDEDRLAPNAFYRDDDVEIDGYKGCPVDEIDGCMNSLFAFVNQSLPNQKYTYLLPHIAHYYLVYVHPYFDYNGRVSRMVSLWVSLLSSAAPCFPCFISEAINQRKSGYYHALEDARDSRNDLTYFLIYIYRVSLDYFYCYKNIENAEAALQNKNITLSSTQKNYLKRILISYKGKFTFKDFEKFTMTNMSKVGALKILNAFEDYGLLSSSLSNSKKKLFDIDASWLTYKMSNIKF
jgi:Fic family protein